MTGIRTQVRTVAIPTIWTLAVKTLQVGFTISFFTFLQPFSYCLTRLDKLYVLLLCQCSQTCGDGQRKRYVTCRSESNVQVDDSYCSSTDKPEEIETCRIASCGVWRTGTWGTVSTKTQLTIMLCIPFLWQLWPLPLPPVAGYSDPGLSSLTHNFPSDSCNLTLNWLSASRYLSKLSFGYTIVVPSCACIALLQYSFFTRLIT